MCRNKYNIVLLPEWFLIHIRHWATERYETE